MAATSLKRDRTEYIEINSDSEPEVGFNIDDDENSINDIMFELSKQEDLASSSSSSSTPATIIDPTESLEIGLKQLNFEQRVAYDVVVEQKHSTFIYGDAGTGKSFLTKLIIRGLEASGRRVYTTGSTGIAALNVGGSTVHGWAGLGLMNGEIKDLVKKAKKIPTWLKTDVLIIDEISMLSADVLEKIDAVARKIRKKPKLPFGGIQVVFIGDFFQLPPVEPNKKVTYAFETKVWKECINHTVELTQQMRQSDERFINMLKEVRNGNVSSKTADAFRSRIITDVKTLCTNNGIEPTILHTHRMDVESENQKRLMELPGPLMEYDATFYSDNTPKGNRELEFLKKSTLAPHRLQLKVGAQVMLLRNLDVESGLANGSRGVVTELTYSYVKVMFKNGIELPINKHSWARENKRQHIRASLRQYPLALAYALTIHKSQGLTLDYMATSIHKAFTTGQAYVALSRARTFEGLYLLSFNVQKITTCPRVKAYYEQMENQNDVSKWSAQKRLLYAQFNGLEDDSIAIINKHKKAPKSKKQRIC
jgi:ATP-dependent DNA helicase PIF1